MIDLDRRLRDALGAGVVSRRALGGGCIAEVSRCELGDGRVVLVKTGGGAFVQEANGLRELGRSGAVRVPEVLHADMDLLVLEHIETGVQPTGFMAAFGRAMADLHRVRAGTFGFDENNLIGATPQRNLPRLDDWAEFYWSHRLELQLRLAEQRRLANDELVSAVVRLEDRLPDWLAGTEEPPTLLHGDLWGGNYLVDARGDPVLIDPAVYYGHREADLAMTRLFGGFSESFHRAYDEANPLPPGHRERVGLYQLYHVLNHLNLFGRSYLGQAVQLARRYADG